MLGSVNPSDVVNKLYEEMKNIKDENQLIKKK